jgi:hypothetical protein
MSTTRVGSGFARQRLSASSITLSRTETGLPFDFENRFSGAIGLCRDYLEIRTAITTVTGGCSAAVVVRRKAIGIVNVARGH